MMRMHTIAPVLAVATALIGCKTKTPITPQQATKYVDAWAGSLNDELMDRTEGASVKKELKSVIQAAAEADQHSTKKKKRPYGVYVNHVYAGLDYKPHLVKLGKLTPAAKAIWADVQHVSDHAIDPKPYRLDEVSADIDALSKVAGDLDPHAFEPTDADKKFAAKFLAGKNIEDFPLNDADRTKLTDVLLAAPQGAHLKKAMDHYEQVSGKLAKQSAQLEYRLASDFTRYAHTLRFQHVRTMFIYPREDDYYNNPEIHKESERPPSARGHYVAGVLWRHAAQVAESMADHKKTLRLRTEKALHDVLTSKTPEKVVASMWPAQPQYRKLVKAYVQYRKIVDDGGWQKVPKKRHLRPGARGKVVKELKKRLQVEGYYPADAKIGSRYGKKLEKAIEAYQTTHQLDVGTKLTRTFWRSLNVPAKRRLSQIALNLKRWRISDIRHDQDPTYVYVNLPDFNVELWDKGKRVMRFPVVIGNNKTVEDPVTHEHIHQNRTPAPVASYIDRAIYNPYWNVTPRIREQEILPKVQAYEQKKYEAWKAQKSYKGLAMLGTGMSIVAPQNGDTALTETTDPNPSANTGTQKASKGDSADDGDKFPYPIDPDTGLVDVSTTDPDHIPGWYKENNYEVKYPGKKWEYVRMLPGDDNALGRVKVIFPNPYDIYLHDTDEKGLFSRTIRAYSHGCMRMKKPLAFAKYLLERDGLYKSHHVKKILKDGTYMPIFLKRKVPVFVEYHTVRVDDQGRPHFLADIYDYDKDGYLVPPPVKKVHEDPDKDKK